MAQPDHPGWGETDARVSIFQGARGKTTDRTPAPLYSLNLKNAMESGGSVSLSE